VVRLVSELLVKMIGYKKVCEKRDKIENNKKPETII